ncbi:uncharacterized protein LOC115208781 [Octopus sinensis]|uniref:Uncharacterized protein LOC115208781 n=1 Tax=Octopus sinensis TaxID=2607531 RepID=A0A6P7S453_9MOLL|nr:uncharacterized protein LOC115208781 [Octopus sinensis]
MVMFSTKAELYVVIFTIICFTVVKEMGATLCYECSTKFLTNKKDNKNCPINDYVKNIAVNKCNGICIYRTNTEHPETYFRSCSTLHSLPKDIPDSGCYSYGDNVFCFCNKDNCNGAPIGDKLNQTVEELPFPDKSNENGNFTKQCFSCQSVLGNGQKNENCPADGKLKKLGSIYRENCTGVCLTRTIVQHDGVVARGCSKHIYKFPKLLPEEGCYKYYMDVICFCRKHLCNRMAMGTPKTKKELDYLELEKKNSSAVRKLPVPLFTFIWLHLLIGIILDYHLGQQ